MKYMKIDYDLIRDILIALEMGNMQKSVENKAFKMKDLSITTMSLQDVIIPILFPCILKLWKERDL